MAEAVSRILPFAAAVAIVPIPIIAVILVLFSQRARANGPLFALGWASGLAVAFVVLLALADAGDGTEDGSASDAIGWGRVLLGLALLALAVRTWRGRPPAGETAELPGWMAGIDEMAPSRALVLGVALAGVNPKNLILIAGAAAALAPLDPSRGDTVAALVTFVVVGSLTVVGPVVYSLVGGAHAATVLDELRTWLGANNAAVMSVLLLVFGVVLLSNGLAPLTGGG